VKKADEHFSRLAIEAWLIRRVSLAIEPADENARIDLVRSISKGDTNFEIRSSRIGAMIALYDVGGKFAGRKNDGVEETLAMVYRRFYGRDVPTIPTVSLEKSNVEKANAQAGSARGDDRDEHQHES
jgi:hypothetical protein